MQDSAIQEWPDSSRKLRRKMSKCHNTWNRKESYHRLIREKALPSISDLIRKKLLKLAFSISLSLSNFSWHSHNLPISKDRLKLLTCKYPMLSKPNYVKSYNLQSCSDFRKWMIILRPAKQDFIKSCPHFYIFVCHEPFVVDSWSLNTVVIVCYQVERKKKEKRKKTNLFPFFPHLT